MRGVAVAAAVLVLLPLAAGAALLAVLARGGATGWAQAYASARLHRAVRFDGGLRVRLVGAGVEARFARLHVARPDWAGPGDVLTAARGRVRLPWTSLLGGRLVADLVEVDGLDLHLTRDAAGRADWNDKPSGGRLSAPLQVRRLILAHGRLRFEDAQDGVTLDAAVSAVPGDPGGLGLHADGAGRVGREPWTLAFRAPAADLGGRAATPFRADLAQGPSRLHLEGEVPAVLDLGRVHGTVRGSGPDLHDLAPLLHVPFPHLVDYALSTRFVREEGRVRLDDLMGRVGRSDVRGNLVVALSPGERRVDGRLDSRSLRVGDLLAVVTGGQAGTRRPAGSAAPAPARPALRAPRRPGGLIPDVAIAGEKLRPLTGRVVFVAASVQPTVMVLRRLTLDARFDHGVVTLDPLALGLPRGEVRLALRLDVRGPTPALALDATLRDASAVDLFGPKLARAPVQASFDGRVRLAGRGSTLHAAAAASSGRVDLAARSGEVKRSAAQVLGADFGGALISLVTRDRSDLPLRCARAEFTVRDGQARADRLDLATAAGRVTGEGALDLRAERLHLVLRGRPARPGLVRAGTSVVVEGPIRAPRARLDAGGPAGLVRTLVSILPGPKPRAPVPAC